jgi:hypothetical protein
MVAAASRVAMTMLTIGLGDQLCTSWNADAESLGLQRSHQVTHLFGVRSVPKDHIGIIRGGR